MRLHFNDDAIQMFEYPSEASLLEVSPPDEVEPFISSTEDQSPVLQTASNMMKNSPNVTASSE